MKTKYYKHPITGKIVEMESGFNLPAMLFGWIYLFIKGDYETGSLLLLLSMGCGFCIYYDNINDGNLTFPALIITLAANIWVAIKWNKDYAEHLVEKGYKIIEENNN